MDLLERINDTLPGHIWSDEDNTSEKIEALADQHAIGFANWLKHYAVSAGYYCYAGKREDTKDMLSIYKRRYPNGY
jgi:hypothetical protein